MGVLVLSKYRRVLFSTFSFSFIVDHVSLLVFPSSPFALQVPLSGECVWLEVSGWLALALMDCFFVSPRLRLARFGYCSCVTAFGHAALWTPLLPIFSLAVIVSPF